MEKRFRNKTVWNRTESSINGHYCTHYDSCAHSIIESLYDRIMKTERQLLLIHYCTCRSFGSCTDLLVLSLPPPQVARANFNEDPYVQDFGISIDQKMVTVTGRILPPPLLQYGGKVGKHVRCVPIAVYCTLCN